MANSFPIAVTSGVGNAFPALVTGASSPPLTVASPTTTEQDGLTLLTLPDPAPSGTAPYTYAWAWETTPGTTTFSNVEEAQPTFTPDKIGETWSAICTVTDASGQVAYYQHTIITGRVVYHIDWTAETSQDISAGGDIDYTTNDGIIWTAVNSASPSAMGLINGTGFQITLDACNPTYLKIGVADLCTPSIGKRYCWLHIVTISGADTDWEAARVGLQSAVGVAKAIASLGFFSWGKVDRLVASGDKHVVIPVVNTTHLWGLEWDGPGVRDRREVTSTYKDPKDLAVIYTDYIDYNAYFELTDVVTLGVICGNGKNAVITYTDSWLVEME